MSLVPSVEVASLIEWQCLNLPKPWPSVYEVDDLHRRRKKQSPDRSLRRYENLGEMEGARDLSAL